MATAKRTSSNTQNSGLWRPGCDRPAARGEVSARSATDGAALIAETGRRLGDVADQDQARLGAEGVGHGGGQIGLEQHVGLADVAPAGDRRAVEHHAALEQRLAYGVGGDRNAAIDRADR